MTKKSFQLYNDYRGMVEALSDEEAGKLFKAVFTHEEGKEAALEGALKGIYVLIANQLDRDRAKYEEKCAANQAIAQRRWNETGTCRDMPPDASACERIPADTGAYGRSPKHADTDTDTDTDKDKDKESDTKGSRGRSHRGAGAPGTHASSSSSTAFVSPTIGEVSAYCRERGSTVDAKRFVDFYESKGWMVGKNRMKDWRAAVRGWETNLSPPKPGILPQFMNISEVI